MRVVRRYGPFRAVLEAAQAPLADDDAWAAGIVRALGDVVSVAHGIGMTIVEHDAECSTARQTATVTPAGKKNLFRMDDGGLADLGRESFRTFYFPEHSVTTHAEVERSLPAEVRAVTGAFRAEHGVDGVLGILAHPEPGRVLVFAGLHDRPVDLTPSDRRQLMQLGLHIEVAYRLRRRPEAVWAVLDADGRVIHQRPDAVAAAERAAHVVRQSDVDLWPALVSGRFSLVARGLGRTRRYLLMENAPVSQPLHALSDREVDVVSLAARGFMVKMIAYALGISSSMVSSRLSTAAAKLGFGSRMDLVRIAAMLARDPRARFAATALSEAEKDVLELLRTGLSNEEIARIRLRSVRTIANQVASLLRKTNSASRRELAVQPYTGVE